MKNPLNIPPKSPIHLTHISNLPKILTGLIGKEFILTGKTRTDGANLRKLVSNQLIINGLPEGANEEDYEITPPKKKGVPKILREFMDTCLITYGETYNLQVWNRIPNSKSPLISYQAGEQLKCNDIRYVLVKIDHQKSIITTIVIATAEYIESQFGQFGKPTIKYQMLISNKTRNQIYSSETKILVFPDTKKLTYLITNTYIESNESKFQEINIKSLYSINLLVEKVAKKLIGRKLEHSPTKNRGQELERIVIELLGYKNADNQNLAGGFPDIPNQLLEVKVQDSQTVDLGKFTPEKEELVITDYNLTTFDVRYLIALTNPKSELIEGIIIAPGEKLSEIFTYVSDVNFKCQRSIPMSFFHSLEGKCVFNP